MMAEDNPLAGTWRLVSYKMMYPDGIVELPYGKEPRGYMLFTDDGFMSVVIVRGDRTGCESCAPLSKIGLAQQADALYRSYCGSYEVREDTLICQVRISQLPQWMGALHVRTFRIERNRLTLTTPEGEGKAPLVMTWEREIARTC
ncbi:MAG: lipocalin-like domain-containing protein [Candidatus Eremiobacteraeota bacterium]|nr:lipocalin-like domain-containing protein [Candidatus Eremiobacteraeota bacterium]